VTGDASLERSLSEQAQIAAAAHASMQAAIYSYAETGSLPAQSQATQGRAMMQRFRAANAAFEAELHKRGSHSLELARWLAVEVAVALSILISSGALFLIRRTARIEDQRQSGGAEPQQRGREA
jgi:CHASE3 domain sensor protein